MGSVVFEDYTIKVIGALDSKINIALEEVAGELESQVKRNQDKFRDTGQTTNSWQHKVDDSTHTAYIGSPSENAIWEELGTGEHALNGDGRKGGWKYKDAKGDWYHTVGKKPRRHLHKAFTENKDKLKKHIQDSLKGL